MLSIILFLLLFCAIVTIHEFGHFIAAKLFNVYVGEFSIGMGKTIYQRKGKETTFSIRLLPLGGFCAMAGEQDDKIETTVETDNIPPERCINNLAPLKRIVIYLAGVFMNILLALVIISFVYLNIGVAYKSPDATIIEVKENYPAFDAGIMTGDKITKVTLSNGYSSSIDSFSEVDNILSLYEEGNITFTISRGDKKITVPVKPTLEDNRYIVGISFDTYKEEKINFFNCWKYSYTYLKEMTLIIVTTILGLFRGVGYNNMSGLVGMYQVTDQAVKLGASAYFQIIAMLSFNIGLMNLIPLPVFDGGRVVLTLIEVITRKPINKKIEEGLMIASLFLALALALYVNLHDIIKLF